MCNNDRFISGFGYFLKRIDISDRDLEMIGSLPPPGIEMQRRVYSIRTICPTIETSQDAPKILLVEK